MPCNPPFHPSLLSTYQFASPKVCALLVAHLLALLDHPVELHRTAAAELLGKVYDEREAAGEHMDTASLYTSVSV